MPCQAPLESRIGRVVFGVFWPDLCKACLSHNILGVVSFNRHLHTTFNCPMKLQKYPLDTQMCPIMIESFAQTMDQMYFKWLDSPIDIDPAVRWLKFHFWLKKNSTHRNRTVFLHLVFSQDSSSFVGFWNLPWKICICTTAHKTTQAEPIRVWRSDFFWQGTLDSAFSRHV